MLEKEALLELFISAFRSGCGCRGTCNCGNVFYNSDGGWDFEEGEIAELEGMGATDIDWGVETIEFDGNLYAVDCNCWQKRANKYIDWIMGFDVQISEFLEYVKRDLYQKAELAPTVDWEPHYGHWNGLSDAPKAKYVEVINEDNKTFRAHFAEDLSGEEQPPFSGWYMAPKDGSGYFVTVPGKVVGWRPIHEK